MPFFLVYGWDPNLPLHHLLEPMQCFLEDLESGRLNLETDWLALAIAKKMLDENHFKDVQKTMDRKPPTFQLGDRVYFKNKQPGKWNLKVETRIQDCSDRVWRTLPTHRKSSHRKNQIIHCKGHNIWTIHWILEHWHSVWQSWAVHKSSCQSTNHQIKQLKMNTHHM